MGNTDEGPVYTTGDTFRARAEAQQRRYRTVELRKPWDKHGHWLAEQAASEGANFILPVCFEAAKARAAAGKGVLESRTYVNMLSSQAMCFNLFAPLAQDSGRSTAAKALSAFVPAINSVESVAIEHTPKNDVFSDQSGQSGVDCDVLVDFRDEAGARGVLTIETKFVEPEFSVCGFRKKGAKSPCPSSVKIGEDGASCGYSKKGFKYWERAREASTLSMERVRTAGCPFSGPSWQLWVNHTLAHAEARRTEAKHAFFAVVAPSNNKALLHDGKTIEHFRGFLARPETFLFIPLDKLIAGLAAVADVPDARKWVDGLKARYVVA